jgi:hypothetical protein
MKTSFYIHCVCEEQLDLKNHVSNRDYAVKFIAKEVFLGIEQR